MAVEKTLLTADDMARMPDGGKRYELVRGELRDLPAGGWEQGIVSSRLDRRVGLFVEANDLGTCSPSNANFVHAATRPRDSQRALKLASSWCMVIST